MLVIFILQRELNAAHGVDLLHGDLGALLGCGSVDGGAAGQRAGPAQQEGRPVRRGVPAAGFAAGRILARAGIRIVRFGGGLFAAGREAAEQHQACEHEAKHFFHIQGLLFKKLTNVGCQYLIRKAGPVQRTGPAD